MRLCDLIVLFVIPLRSCLLRGYKIFLVVFETHALTLVPRSMLDLMI